MHGRKRPFSTVFDPFHINRITDVFCHIVSECKRSDTAFFHSMLSFSTVYDTVKYGRNAANMKRVKYGPFTVINDSIRDGFQRIRSRRYTVVIRAQVLWRNTVVCLPYIVCIRPYTPSYMVVNDRIRSP